MSFPNNTVLIPIGEKSYTNVCTNTDVFLDGDFISAFASLVCHHNHSTTSTVPIKSGKVVPQLTHVTIPNSVLAIKDCKQLPKGIQCIVAVMHTKLHYAVMEITVDTKIIKIFDGLRYDLLEWKDHVIRVMRICILVDPNVGRRGTNQLHLLEGYLDALVKHTTEIPPPTALVEGTTPSALVEGISLR